MDSAGASIMLNTPYITQHMNMSILKKNTPSTNVALVGAVATSRVAPSKYAARVAASTGVYVHPTVKGVNAHRDGAEADVNLMSTNVLSTMAVVLTIAATK